MVATVDELIEKSDLLVITRDAESLMGRVAELGKRLPFVDLSGRKHRKSTPVTKTTKTETAAMLAAVDKAVSAPALEPAMA